MNKAEQKAGSAEFRRIIESTFQFSLRPPCYLWPWENRSWGMRFRSRLCHRFVCRSNDHEAGKVTLEWQLKQKTVADR